MGRHRAELGEGDCYLPGRDKCVCIHLIYTGSHSDQKNIPYVEIECHLSKGLYKIIEMFSFAKKFFYAAIFVLFPNFLFLRIKW